MMTHLEPTNISYIGLILMLFMGGLIFFLPRRFAILPVLVITCWATAGQRLEIMTLNFYMLRIILLFGWARIIFRGELFSIKLNIIDKIVIIYIVWAVIAYTLLRGTGAAFINRLGFAYNTVGAYFFFRAVIRDFDDIVRAIKILSIVIIPLALGMLLEQATRVNIFSTFGGVPLFSEEREGRFRAQGPFEHAILAGTFGATLIPLFVSLWFSKENRTYAVIGVLAATLITIASASSGPILTLIIIVGALCVWPFRKYIRTIEWGILFGVIGLHLYMKAPVWYVISRVSDLIGGTGWHRSFLIDQAIKYFNEWWLLGTTYTAHWMPYALAIDPDYADITNQFIAEGVQGGFTQMLLFIVIIVLCFRSIGRAIKLSEDQPLSIKIVPWSMGVVLFGHVSAFFSVSYFDQIFVSWYLALAMISAIAYSIEKVKSITPQKLQGERVK